jgi:hypothetical protein
MKKLCNYIAVGFVYSLCFKASAFAMGKPHAMVIQFPVDTLLTTLQSLSLSQYSGKPADSILAHLPPGIIDMKITGWRSIRRAEILHVVYPNKVVVEIHVKEFQYMNPEWVNTPTPTENWSVPLFRKETVAHVVIFNGSACINGCENKYK